eukprot:788914-Amphidinium_carterae.1
MLLATLNDLMNSEHFPAAWRTTTVIPIPKAGASQSTVKGFRPITLQPVFLKVLEILLLPRISRCCPPPHPNQYGFVKGKSAELKVAAWIQAAIHDLTSSSSTSRNRGRMLAVKVDFAKAFDTVDTSVLIKQLASHGVPYHILRLLGHHWADRHSRAHHLGVRSVKRKLVMGLPQGS